MGEDVERRKFTRQDRHQFRQKVQDCLDALAIMLADETFQVGEPQIGMEIELNLVDEDMAPSMANAEVLDAIADPDYQTELGQFNIEINVDPRPLRGSSIAELETDLRRSLNAADERARGSGSRLAMIGMLPTLTKEHFEHRWLSANPRYDLLNQQIFAARGEDIELKIAGVRLPGSAAAENLDIVTDTILPEAACTSVQLHLQVAPDEFASYWNAAQALSGVQVALAANSPFLAGRALWHETRIPLFEQATDTRPQELKNQGVRPRVWFGERWITSIFDLFEENSRYFPALLPVCSEEDPKAALARGDTPWLSELRMHNGTVYRWNRPIYDRSGDGHHIRLENRVLPAGPTVVDTLADAAFYYGTVRALADADRPLWSQMSFDAAEENVHSAARGGFDSMLYWPEVGWVSPQELVLRRLLPMAEAGLAAYGVDSAVRDRYLGIIEARCLAKQSGSGWQRAAVVARERAGDTREQALAGMLGDYVDRMDTGEPVHTWTH
ncbi:glutamate--cysteine ligase [Rhodococcus fascians]|nr:glutamate--cysteine ligase [Rhodococcus fascians]MBY4140595.1 glutamate--cysteine ligase [Rhodococcus fascians]MBY4219260.1 glutamate--cysteine ligase [Rhodococcus fascians]MBY4223634.1 glutamate--cysteine ligase [Rhodococcus fascians]MBY4231310.1 glutamate--cysteine ligase [Rhodococcus fascians]